jgi:hypothetical protein
MSASLRPGISMPLRMRLMSSIGSISAPTFSSSARMKTATEPSQKGSARDGRGMKRSGRTRLVLGVAQQVFPEILIVLLPSKLDRPLDVAQAIDDEHERLLGVAHPAEQEDHLGDIVALLADEEGLRA